MDIILINKASEMMQGKSNFGGGVGGVGNVWVIISIACLIFAMWHAYNANKCEKQKSKLIAALVLSFLFPKLATLYYAMKYQAMPWGASENPRLLEKYYVARADRDSWDLDKCAKWVGKIDTPLTSHLDL